MSMIGSSWEDEPTPEERYEDITGQKYFGSRRNLEKDIENEINSSYTSKTSRNQLRDLLNDINEQD
jgi:hypothetical protein